jgi:hypothetical protein
MCDVLYVKPSPSLLSVLNPPLCPPKNLNPPLFNPIPLYTLYTILRYGVVRPSLGGEMPRVLYLGGAYFVLSFAYQLLVGFSSNTRRVADSDYDLVRPYIFIYRKYYNVLHIYIFFLFFLNKIIFIPLHVY